MLLLDHCHAYDWAKPVLCFVRESNWPELYAWIEHATTEVYGTAAEHFAVAQVAALVKKYPLSWKEFGFDQDPESTAMDKFYASERKCRLVNLRFNTLRNRFTVYKSDLEYMRNWILHVIGEQPDLREIYSKCSFSGGASVGVHGNATNLYRKLFAERWSGTSCALPYALHALWSNDQVLLSYMDSRDGYVCYDYELATQRMREKCTRVTYNLVSFVPKTAKTHRSIAVEPLLNSFIQKGTDVVLRDLLRAHGYDLTDQTKNANLARTGSIDGSFATIDLSAASDSVCIALCKYMLPPAWFDFLNRIRSSNYRIGEKETPYEKFVSMGNGFCFPLETLLFAAATRASLYSSQSVCKEHAVYGDDIVVPTPSVKKLQKILNYCGFSVNPDKSFTSGPFRESCGADWYLGQDVRPVYLDYHLSDDVRLMIFHNATYRGPRTDDCFTTVRGAIREWVPFKSRMCRPRSAQPPYDSAASLTDKAIANGAFSVDQDTFMGSHWSKWSSDIWNWQWREVLTRPVADALSDEAENNNNKLNFNTAQYLAFLSGNPSGELYLRRKTRLAYKNK